MRRSSPLTFISLLHVSILKDHHQGVNVPIYEAIECFLFFDEIIGVLAACM